MPRRSSQRRQPVSVATPQQKERKKMRRMLTVKMTDTRNNIEWTQLFYEDEHGLVGIEGTLEQTFECLARHGVKCEVVNIEER